MVEVITLERFATDGFVALDLETTGLDPRRDAVVAVAAIPFVDGEPHAGLRTLVNPGRPIPAASTRIHGLTDAVVAGEPPIGDVLPRLAAACEGRVVVGYALGFDLAVLERAARAAARPPLRNLVLDTRELAAVLYPSRMAPTLEALADRLAVPVVGRHTAAGDAIIAGRILLRLLRECTAQGIRSLPDLLRLQRAAHRWWRL